MRTPTRALALVFGLVGSGVPARAQEEGATGLDRWPKAPRPEAPFIRHRGCPFECCRYGQWTLVGSAVVRRRPSAKAPVSFRLVNGAPILADTGFVRIDPIGLVILRAPHRDEMNDIPYVAGDSLFVLDYVGENVHNAWLRGRAIQTVVDELPGRVVREPRAQWWARIRDRRGRVGWVDMDKTNVSGADACGG